MSGRFRLLGLAAALLYLGPVVAGLAGHPAAVLPVFALLFLMWLAVLRPGLWPAKVAGWGQPGPWLALVGRAAVQAVLVLVYYGLGRLVGPALPPMAVPLWLPVLMSGVAVPLARAVWNPGKAEAMDRFVTDALRQVEEKTGNE